MGCDLFIARSVWVLGLGRPIHHCQRMDLRRGPVTNQCLAQSSNSNHIPINDILTGICSKKQKPIQPSK